MSRQVNWQIRFFIRVTIVGDIEKLIKRDLIDLEKEKVGDNLDLFTEIHTTPFFEKSDLDIDLFENSYYLLIFNLLN
jgi:hypothetical protein